MTLHIDLYYTMRSPYCYLSTTQLVDLVTTYDLEFHLKPVYPLAISDPSFFKRVNPSFMPYLARDTQRIAKRLNIPFRWPPSPDPVIQDLKTRAISPEQPHIRRLTHFAQIAAEKERGLEFVASVSALLFNPDIDGWDQGDNMAVALAEAGLNIDEFEKIASGESDRLHSAVVANREAQLATGHWGAPLFVFEGEVFFGQDRIEDLVWHLKNNGLLAR